MTEKRAKGSWQEHDAIDATEDSLVDVEKGKAVHELVQSKNMGLMKIRTNAAFFVSEDSRSHVVIRVVVL